MTTVKLDQAILHALRVRPDATADDIRRILPATRSLPYQQLSEHVQRLRGRDAR